MTVIIRGQKDSEKHDHLNATEIETDEDRIINFRRKKQKKPVFRFVSVDLPFLSRVKNNTDQTFITSNRLNEVKTY